MSKAPAVDYALEIIEFFSKTNEEIGIADISNALNINKNAISRILEALIEKNWIYVSNVSQKKYSLTLRPFSLIAGHTNQRGIAKIAAPYVERLNQKLGDAVYLGVKSERNVLYLVHCDSKREVRINGCVGGEYPLNCSAPGKILLCYSGEQEIRDYFEKSVDKRTTNTITDFESFMIEAEKIKKSDYAIDNEEFAKGIICIATPIFDHDGNVVASIGISSLTLYDDIYTLISNKLILLQKTANEISLCLGHKSEKDRF